VRYSRWERGREISFIPPDGVFQLAKYRSSKPIDMPLYVKPQFAWHDAGGKVTVMVGHRAAAGKREVEEVVVVVPFPKGVASATFSHNTGSVGYDPITRVRGAAVACASRSAP
jgi:hypothetical protein